MEMEVLFIYFEGLQSGLFAMKISVGWDLGLQCI